MGFAQVSPNGNVAIGTYVNNGVAFLQTHTKHNLNFATNNGTASMVLDTLRNLGINVSAPAEKLDVGGNVNMSGQLKFSGDGGTAGQVVMKDANNNPMWADLSDYKYLAVYNNVTYATAAGNNNASYSCTVPAGVTSIYLEAWSGGGGGGTMSGGGGGGYMAFQSPVTPGATVSLVVGAGGIWQYSSQGIPGGTTSVSINGGNYSVNGGSGGRTGDPTAYTIFAIYGAPGGGGLSTAGALNNKVISSYGNAGKLTTITFTQASASEFVRYIAYGDGGDAAMFPGTASKGGYRIYTPTNSYNISGDPGYGGPQGTGGASGPGGGTGGGGGLVIIHY